MATAFILCLLGLTQSSLASFDCEAKLGVKNYRACCQLPKLYPDEVVKECTDLNEENTKIERTKKLQGPRRGDVRNLVNLLL